MEQDFYEIATREVAEKNLVAGVYGKAFSEALGDTQVALALYIRLRVEQLKEQEQQRSQQRQRDARRRAGLPEPMTRRDLAVYCAWAIAIGICVWFWGPISSVIGLMLDGGQRRGAPP